MEVNTEDVGNVEINKGKERDVAMEDSGEVNMNDIRTMLELAIINFPMRPVLEKSNAVALDE
ncbi:conserved hypothetical protein [Ricinus communis]|uniref:Uncharacterized protein n=1 Tax=Ricinus communis TaxID=3988 RepID=B9REL1_RICCO|nr:conserved hypothetical protein [Ricinus communis]